MSGFSADWLHLREPLDAAARDPGLAHRFAAALPERPRLLDIGAGTGSALRWLAPRLGRPAQRWTLADGDDALLAAAPQAVAGWAAGQPWLHLEAETLRTDLATGFEALDLPARDGVVASAVLDLVSEAWAGRFATALAAAGRPPVLAMLSVDGRVAFDPADADDAFVLARVAVHSGRDKGFGPALGARAPHVVAAALERAGYAVTLAPSDWRLDPAADGSDGTAAALRALVAGYAAAATQTDPDAADRIAAWAAWRRSTPAVLHVGHRDLLAVADQARVMPSPVRTC